jgi:hypothetical protein
MSYQAASKLRSIEDELKLRQAADVLRSGEALPMPEHWQKQIRSSSTFRDGLRAWQINCIAGGMAIEAFVRWAVEAGR